MKRLYFCIIGIISSYSMGTSPDNQAVQKPLQNSDKKQITITVNFNMSNAHKQDNTAGPEQSEQTTTQQPIQITQPAVTTAAKKDELLQQSTMVNTLHAAHTLISLYHLASSLVHIIKTLPLPF